MRHIFFISLIFSGFFSVAINNTPKILRACLNFTDSTVTISWKAPMDNCGSFTKYSLYGKTDASIFQKLDDIPQLSITEYPHKITNLSERWEYFLTIDFLCDGTTTSYSDTISIDLTYPATIELDSTSYDFTTQKIIAGWPTNPSSDTRNYEIYDYTSGDGDSIGSTTNTYFTVSDARTGRFPVVISTIDSCSLSSLLSTPHTPAYLNATIDTCLKEITLSWSKYAGWNNIDSQSLYISFDGNSYFKDTTFSGSLTNFVFSNFQLGDTLSFFVRSYTRNGQVTSSSNVTTIETRQFVVPQLLYLSLATVLDDFNGDRAIPKIQWHTDNTKDVKAYSLEEGLTIPNLIEISTIPAQNTTLDYYSMSPNRDGRVAPYYYRVSALDKCNDTLLTSNIGKTIHFDISTENIHNEYVNWEKGVEQYYLEKHDGSTWNTISSQPKPFQIQQFSDSSGCYRISASEDTNSYGFSSKSHSNIICLEKPLSFEITTGLNPDSNNNRFRVIGVGIDHTLSSYVIYNRWGQKIAENNTGTPWYADYQGTPVSPGVYIYIVNLVGLKGEKQSAKGIINVLK